MATIGTLKAKLDVDTRKGIAGINAFSGALKGLGNVSNQTSLQIPSSGFIIIWICKS